jgi:hypothetical protein
LVEHLLCKQGVIGSNPIVSMCCEDSEAGALPLDPVKGGAFEILWFPKALGLWWVKGKALAF